MGWVSKLLPTLSELWHDLTRNIFTSAKGTRQILGEVFRIDEAFVLIGSWSHMIRKWRSKWRRVCCPCHLVTDHPKWLPLKTMQNRSHSQHCAKFHNIHSLINYPGLINSVPELFTNTMTDSVFHKFNLNTHTDL